MALLFSRKIQAVLGVDISATAVKILELQSAHKQLWVQNFALVPLMPNAILDYTIKDPNAVNVAIQEAYAQMPFTTRRVAIAMPSPAIISKTLQVDAALSEEELEAHIQLEAAAVIPFSLDEVCMDFSILGVSKKDPAKADVLLVAARRTQVDARREMVTAAGLIVDFIDVETFAIERVMNHLTYKDTAQTTALLHFDGTSMTLIVLRHSRVVYSHEELLSAQQLTESIESLTPLLRRAMQFFLSSVEGCQVDQILLSGVGIDGINAMVAECLSLPVALVEPFQNMPLAAGVDAKWFQQERSALMVACGLALRGVNHHDRN